MISFEFATATRIIFGAGSVAQVAPAARQMGARALLIDGTGAGIVERVAHDLAGQGIDVLRYKARGEPTVEGVQAATDQARETGRDLVIGVGGGSAMDTAKAVAALLANGGEPLDYLEIVGRGKALSRPSAPCIAVTTTSGTGAEVTRNAVVASKAHAIKASMRSPTMYVRLAVVDPELTLGVPPAVTANTGLDALTQLIEPFVCDRANPLTDGYCREGMARAARSLRRAFEHGHDAAAREDMALASLLGGLALANAGLGAAHGLAAPIGGEFPGPHGALCARLLPPVMAANVQALSQRAPESAGLARYDEVARILTGNAGARAADGVAWVVELGRALNVPPLSAYGVGAADLPALAEKGAAASSMKANPIRLTHAEIVAILEQAL